jgi:hypothetical protein
MGDNRPSHGWDNRPSHGWDNRRSHGWDNRRSHGCDDRPSHGCRPWAITVRVTAGITVRVTAGITVGVTAAGDQVQGQLRSRPAGLRLRLQQPGLRSAPSLSCTPPIRVHLASLLSESTFHPSYPSPTYTLCVRVSFSPRRAWPLLISNESESNLPDCPPLPCTLGQGVCLPCTSAARGLSSLRGGGFDPLCSHECLNRRCWHGCSAWVPLSCSTPRACRAGPERTGCAGWCLTNSKEAFFSCSGQTQNSSPAQVRHSILLLLGSDTAFFSCSGQTAFFSCSGQTQHSSPAWVRHSILLLLE